MRVAAPSEFDTLYDIDLDSSALFERAGLHMDFPDDHEFALAERHRWTEALSAGTTLLAVDTQGDPIGFAAVGAIDGEPYLAQLSVRVRCMQRGVGSALVEAAARMISEFGAPALWLTTYAHLPWNRPFYQRRGFDLVPDDQCGAGMTRQLFLERRWLPRPEERVAMRRTMGAR